MSDLEKKEPIGCFTTTKWTLVIQVIQQGDNEAAVRALQEFCLQYRAPIYGFIRRRGYGHERAEDLVHDFVRSRLLQNSMEADSFVHRAQRQQGRFRSFLSHVLIRFLQDQARADGALSAGGKADHVSTEVLSESGQTLPGTVEADGGRQFDLEFARTIIALATQQLKHSAHHLAVLMGKKQQAEVAHELGMSEPTFRVNHLRFRQRFGAAIREEIKKVVGEDENEVNEEIRYLMSLFERVL